MEAEASYWNNNNNNTAIINGYRVKANLITNSVF